ncbi:chloride channel protein [Acetobacteraceae bacterium ESL0709]|nr:chloride channel protein [Acetobacteraceae bacterium ESL0697]MDF7678964.1 chloride channel protein [Acetobacteraceae bacterium ESL0709]
MKSYAPFALRVLVRQSEIGLTLLAAVIGALGGCCVLIITRLTLMAHALFYGLDNGGRLSGLTSLPLWRCLIVLGGGGIAVGLFTIWVGTILKRRPVDPIEANALHGGRMSVRDSLVVVAQTLISNGVGASIGLEAGFTQIAASLGSFLGRSFRVRREDLRILVGAGAAGAIGSAFDAPIAGAFYAFELVIGTYSLVSLCPVAVASITGLAVVNFAGGLHNDVRIPHLPPIEWHEAPGVIILSVLCSLIAILIMYGVTQSEALFRRLPGPQWTKSLWGGLAVGTLAAWSPSVLSAGHEAMRLVLEGKVLASATLFLLVAKALASSLSIGSGFRGGLFFASLYLGSLAGTGFGTVLAPYGLAPDNITFCALIGMSAMAVAIIGAPMTIISMILEMIGQVSLGPILILSAILSFLTTRRLFGYSFATWRFHLRGESIRSAVDVGWIRSLTVQSLMRVTFRSLHPSVSVSQAQSLFPLGTGNRIILIDGTGRYQGMVSIIDLHACHDGDKVIGALAGWKNAMLTPQMNIKDAASLFVKFEVDALVVVEDLVSCVVVGQLGEAYALRRYAAELERSRRELAGEDRFSV